MLLQPKSFYVFLYFVSSAGSIRIGHIGWLIHTCEHSCEGSFAQSLSSDDCNNLLCYNFPQLKLPYLDVMHEPKESKESMRSTAAGSWADGNLNSA